MRELPFSHRGFGSGAFLSSQFFGMFINPIVIVYFAGSTGSRAPVLEAIGMLMAALAALVVLAKLYKPSGARVAS
jgi:hypothetical protein